MGLLKVYASKTPFMSLLYNTTATLVHIFMKKNTNEIKY